MNELWPLLDTIETICDQIDYISLIVFSVILVVICNVGFSVYHFVMNKNVNSNCSLLNIMYEQLAVLFEIGSFIILGKV